MAGPKIVYYYDIVSPFAYMAFLMLRHSPAFRGVEITYMPVQLGLVFKLTGNRPPLDTKNKSTWIDIERNRWARTFNLPVAANAPAGFPVFTGNILRVLTALRLNQPQHLETATEAIWTEFWGPAANAKQVEQPAALEAVLAGAIGAEAARRALEESRGDAAKEELKKASAAAVEQHAAFGVPWFVCTDAQGREETFWGFDHFGQVLDHCGLDRTKFGVKGDGIKSVL